MLLYIKGLTSLSPHDKISEHSDKTYAALAHLVERHLAKVEVASSSLVSRSIKKPI